MHTYALCSGGRVGRGGGAGGEEQWEKGMRAEKDREGLRGWG